MVSGRPVLPAELDRAKASLTLTLPGTWETIGAVAGTIDEIVVFGLDDRYFDTYADKVRAQTPASVTSAATRTVLPDHLVWVIVGDRARIESGLRSLDLGEFHLVDADGNPRPTS
jgi:zinc protease